MKAPVASFLLLGVVFLATVQPADGYPVTIYIEAVVDTVEDHGNYLEDQISPGNLITGYYIYELTTPDSSPEDWLGKYEYSQAPYGITLDVGGFRFETNPDDVDFTVYISNDRISPTGDIYNIVSNNNSTLHNGTDVGWMYWQLDDRSGQALSNTSLPLTAPVLGDWQDGNVLRIEGVPRQADFVITAHVTSAVPEPSSLLLLGTGFLGLIFKGWRK
jgi:hypothetical protein